MSRIRTIKPDFWEDAKVGQLSAHARLLFLGALNLADDAGRLRWSPDYLNSSLFMYDELPLKRVRALMDEVEAQVMVVAYDGSHTGQHLAYVPNFLKHQRINRPQPSRLPSPPGVTDSLKHSVNGTVNQSMKPAPKVREPFTGGREGKGMEGNPLPYDAAPEPSPRPTSKPEQDEADQQPLTPQAQALADRWLSIVGKPDHPLRQAETNRIIPQLLARLDDRVLDEIIGKCWPSGGRPPGSIRYLVAACRRWASDHHVNVDFEEIR